MHEEDDDLLEPEHDYLLDQDFLDEEPAPEDTAHEDDAEEDEDWLDDEDRDHPAWHDDVDD